LTLKWVPREFFRACTNDEQTLQLALIKQYPLIDQLQADQLLDLHVQCCRTDDLQRHPRSGKCLRFLDRRDYGPGAMEYT